MIFHKTVKSQVSNDRSKRAMTQSLALSTETLEARNDELEAVISLREKSLAKRLVR